MPAFRPPVFTRSALALALIAPPVTMLTIFALEWSGFYRNPVDAYAKKNTMLAVLLVLPSLAALWLAGTGLLKLRREEWPTEKAAPERFNAKLAIVLSLLWLVGLFPFTMIRYTREARMYQAAAGRERISHLLDICQRVWQETGQFPQSLDALLADPAIRARVQKDELLTWPFTRKGPPMLMMPPLPTTATAPATQKIYPDIRSDWVYLGNDLRLSPEQMVKHGGDLVLMVTEPGAILGGYCVAYANGKSQMIKDRELTAISQKSEKVRAALGLPPAVGKPLDEPARLPRPATQAASQPASQPG